MTSGLLASHELGHSFSHLRWVVNNFNSVGLKACNLRLSVSLSTGNNGTSVAHSSSWWCGLTSNKANNWEVAFIIGAEPLGGLLFGFSTDLTNHYNSFGFWVVNESGEDINEVGSIEWITTDSDNG